MELKKFKVQIVFSIIFIIILLRDVFYNSQDTFLLSIIAWIGVLIEGKLEEISNKISEKNDRG